MTAPGEAFARMFVGFAHIDEDGAGLDQLGGGELHWLWLARDREGERA